MNLEAFTAQEIAAARGAATAAGHDPDAIEGRTATDHEGEHIEQPIWWSFLDAALDASPASSDGDPDGELWEADPDCRHVVVDACGGGVRCTKCPGWFCY